MLLLQAATLHAWAGQSANVTQALQLVTSAGQLTLVVVHISAMSQAFAAGRQIFETGPNVSAGQATLVPVHASVTSHVPAAALQIFPAGANVPLGGQVPLEVQKLLSHGPPEARQVTVGLVTEMV